MTIVIFDTISGLTDQIRDIQTQGLYCKENNISFSMRYSSCRPLSNSEDWKLYEIQNLFNIDKIFSNEKNYINYEKIKEDINNKNSYNFFENKIKNFLWQNSNRSYFNEQKMYLIHLINLKKYKYIFIGGGFWWWHSFNLLFNSSGEQICKTLQIYPSDKIIHAYTQIKKDINCERYNFIHYRYEDDWNNLLKVWNQKYILPSIDDIYNKVKFKENLPLFIATSNIELLHEKNLLKNDLNSYSNFIYKKKSLTNELNYDENGFIDFLIGTNAQEVFGFSHSGFSKELNKIKRTNNYYDKLECFQDEQFYKKI